MIFKSQLDVLGKVLYRTEDGKEETVIAEDIGWDMYTSYTVHLARITHEDGTKEIVPGYRLYDLYNPQPQCLIVYEDIKSQVLQEIKRDNEGRLIKIEMPLIFSTVGWFVRKIIARRFDLTEEQVMARYNNISYQEMYDMLGGEFDHDLCCHGIS